MSPSIIYLASLAGSARDLLKALRCAGAADLIAQIQAAVGDGYLVEGDPVLIEAPEDELRGGRSDDAERAAALQRRLADDRTAAVVALRGGAWLTRILGNIGFDVLRCRRRRIALFGFSELTPLLNIAASYPQAFCVHDLVPAFIRKGLRDYARRHPERLSEAAVEQEFPGELAVFFRDVCSILEGRGSRRTLSAICVVGEWSGAKEVRFVGGNLALLTTLPGTLYARAVEPRGRWLVLEDINETPDRIDRRLAHLKLAGWFEHCAGLLLGDFHDPTADYQEAVLQLLPYHLPADRQIPILLTRDVGHIWPMAPLPLNTPVTLEPAPTPGNPRAVRCVCSWPTITEPQDEFRASARSPSARR